MIVSELMEACFPSPEAVRSRPSQITNLYLRCYIGETLLSECQEFFVEHKRTASCFKDIREFVESLSPEDATKFVKFGINHVVQMKARLEDAEKVRSVF